MIGSVYIIGAGPGDPELLTLKAARLLERADIVFYDDLVSAEVLNFTRNGSLHIPVGKRCNASSESQERIHELLRDAAFQHETIVRLKGGDPALFSRVGEEIQFLRTHGIPFEVIPGITAASAMSASMNIPLTFRGVSRSAAVLTGHSRSGEHLEPLKTISLSEQTVLIYMGLNSLSGIVQTLLEAGNDPSTPIAIMEKVSLPGERRIQGELATIEDLCHAHHVTTPALIVIGDILLHFPIDEALDSIADRNHELVML